MESFCYSRHMISLISVAEFPLLRLYVGACCNRGGFYAQLCVKQIFFFQANILWQMWDTKLLKDRSLVPLETT